MAPPTRPEIGRAMSHPRSIVVSSLLLILAGCGSGDEVTTRSLANAKRTWDAAKIRDYNLEWMSTGAREGHYVVFVRGGKVQEIRGFVDDPRQGKLREIPVKPGDPSYYGVEGLFKIMEEERA